MEAYALLRRAPLFAEVDDAELRRVAMRCNVRILGAGDILVRAGSPQRDVFYLASGAVVLYRRNHREDVTMALGILSGPALFGDAEWAAGVPWMVSVRAEVDATVVCIENAAFAKLAQEPAVAYRLYRDACVRHLLANHTAQVMAIYDVETRLLRLLLDHGERVGQRGDDAMILSEPIGPVALAAHLGVNRRTITRALKSIEAQGWLVREGERWTLKRLREMEGILPPHLLGFSTTSGEQGAVFSRWSGQLGRDES